MSKPILALVATAALAHGVLAAAQGMPMRGAGMLAMNASEAQSGVSSSPSELIETPDSGGGATPAHNERGSGDVGSARGVHGGPSMTHALPDALPPAEIMQHGDPAAPAAATPKRPSYRWQSLVPGAIK